jgi:hypothetical protein
MCRVTSETLVVSPLAVELPPVALAAPEPDPLEEQAAAKPAIRTLAASGAIRRAPPFFHRLRGGWL